MSSLEKDFAAIDIEESEVEQDEKRAKVDFKMVTFSLGGRAYGIDIMRVKEISKAGRFTVVPNTPNYVEGVHNLRGEIIPVINLRRMFHLEELTRKKNELANVLILRIEESIVGVIVDRIDNVIGLDSSTIQPRHPLFTDINMKYIHGIVEVEEKLFVILDVEKIFGSDRDLSGDEIHVRRTMGTDEAPEKTKKAAPLKPADQDFQFITDTLKTFSRFHVDALNASWVKQRLADWKKIRQSEKKDVQLEDPEDALNFLIPFYSPCNGMLWNHEYRDRFVSLLNSGNTSAWKVWAVGTGQGQEAYSITAILKLQFPEARIKVWACDNDLLSISSAPTMSFAPEMIPEYLEKSGFLKESGKNFVFGPEFRDLLYFEYHDARHAGTLPELDLIVARDLLSFFDLHERQKILADFTEKLKPGGLLIIGEHEELTAPGWKKIEGNHIAGYTNEKN
ncbi:MAG: chemotaxis protein CheW [Spirochaetales bacterium]|nr:chemotaxis protein CheW [Spirochaetales bacterium]